MRIWVRREKKNYSPEAFFFTHSKKAKKKSWRKERKEDGERERERERFFFSFLLNLESIKDLFVWKEIDEFLNWKS